MSKSQGKSTFENVEGAQRDIEDPTGAGEEAIVSTEGTGTGTGGVKVGPRSDSGRPTRGEGNGGGAQKVGPRTNPASPRTRGEGSGTPAQKQGGPTRNDGATRSDR